MFILSNSYQIKDLKNEVFSTVFDAQSQISFFISTGEIKAYSSNTDLYSLAQSKSKKIVDLKSTITCLKSQNMLICAGTQNGEIHIFSEHRAAIRQFKNHSADITDIVITPSNLIISSGKDGKINFYDLTEGTRKHSIQMQSGYVRNILVSNQQLYLFSKNIAIYSLEDFSLIQEVSFGSMIEHSVQISDNSILFTCKNKGYLLDTDSLEIVYPITLHSRDITMIHLYEDKIYTSSLDGHLKSFNKQLRCISDIQFSNKLASFVLVNDIPIIATTDGKFLSIEEKKDYVEQRKIRHNKPAYHEEIEYSVIQNTKKRITEIERMLQNYEFKGAVRYCIAKNDLSQTFAVLKYIYEKRQLNKVVTDSDIDFLIDLLQLCFETIKINEFTPIVTEILTIITARYYDEIIHNEDTRELIQNIGDALTEILAFEEICLKAISFIESFPEQ